MRNFGRRGNSDTGCCIVLCVLILCAYFSNSVSMYFIAQSQLLNEQQVQQIKQLVRDEVRAVLMEKKP